MPALLAGRERGSREASRKLQSHSANYASHFTNLWERIQATPRTRESTINATPISITRFQLAVLSEHRIPAAAPRCQLTPSRLIRARGADAKRNARTGRECAYVTFLSFRWNIQNRPRDGLSPPRGGPSRRGRGAAFEILQSDRQSRC